MVDLMVVIFWSFKCGVNCFFVEVVCKFWGGDVFWCMVVIYDVVYVVVNVLVVVFSCEGL